MGAVKTPTQKELMEQAEIAEKSAKKFDPSSTQGQMGVNTKGRDAAQSSQPKGKETMAVELSGTTQPKQKSSTHGNQEFKFPPKVYSFKDEQVVTIFHFFTSVTSSSYLKFGDQIKWHVQLILTTASFIGWCITLLADALSSRTRSKYWWMLKF